MRKFLKNTALSLGETTITFPWLVNSITHSARLLSSIGSHYRDSESNYSAIATIDPADTPDFNDHELNFFIRLMLERKYDFVIELGAYTLSRSRTLHSCFPEVRIYGLDVTSDFTERRVVDGVTVGPYSLDEVSEIVEANKSRGLMCARGTLMYYAKEEAVRLLSLAFSKRLDMAICEPTSVRDYGFNGSWRRSKISYYHPYVKMLRAQSYLLPDMDAGRAQARNISGMAETWSHIFAVHPLNLPDVRTGDKSQLSRSP